MGGPATHDTPYLLRFGNIPFKLHHLSIRLDIDLKAAFNSRQMRVGDEALRSGWILHRRFDFPAFQIQAVLAGDKLDPKSAVDLEISIGGLHVITGSGLDAGKRNASRLRPLAAAVRDLPFHGNGFDSIATASSKEDTEQKTGHESRSKKSLHEVCHLKNREEKTENTDGVTIVSGQPACSQHGERNELLFPP